MMALSLIIPVKNEENNLVHLCQSLSVQEFKDSFEVVIVDDSDFNHAKYVDSCIDILRGSEVRAKYLRGSGDGVGSAMFKGLSASGGRYVYFLDADNILRKDFMSKVIPYLKEDVAVSFLSGGVILKGITGLFYGTLLLAALRGGLKFHRR
jgi:glycosyltransferase involved in cell wall biosynthesis